MLITVLKTLSTVMLGGAGGWASAYLGLPLPWLMGSMLTVSLAAIFGLSVNGHGLHIPPWLRTSMVPIIGVMLGSAFTPATLAGMREWWITLSALLGFILACSGIVYFFYRRVLRFDPATAYFSSIPGGLIDMAIIGEAYGGDSRTISLIHFSRILISVVTLPFVMRWLYGVSGGSVLPGAETATMELKDLVLLSVCAVVGYFGGRLIRLPGAQISGPLVLSAFVHATQLTTASPPDWLIIIAQVVVGSGLGARFSGVSIRAAGKLMLSAFAATILMFSVTVTTALTLAPFVDQSLAALLLAYAPGGVTEMSLIALSLNIGVAFITTHHIARIALSIGLMPLLWKRVIQPRMKPG